MRKRFLKTAALAAGCLGWIGAITMAEAPPQQWASGWFWRYPSAVCVGYCQGDWDDPDLWEFKGWYVPLYDYPQMEYDDAYVTWTRDQALQINLSTETIDACVFYVGPDDGEACWLRFESKDSPSNGLTCDHVSFTAVGGRAVFTVADNAAVKTAG